jgi:replicative DNA helicase
MKLSVPIYQLKREAKRLAREGKLPLSAALDRVAAAEGFSGWSLLAARYAESSPAAKLYGRLQPGELVLVGARPGQGKTLLALELAAEAAKSGGQGMFFTLEYTDKDVLDRLRAIGREPAELGDRFGFDCSDRISAAYIIDKMATAPRGTLVVVDYLQLLDQRRENPPLAEQVRALKAFAEARGLVIVFISQIDRSYDPAEKPYPDARDIRLPNPVDLELFSKSWFLNNGEISLQAAG